MYISECFWVINVGCFRIFGYVIVVGCYGGNIVLGIGYLLFIDYVDIICGLRNIIKKYFDGLIIIVFVFMEIVVFFRVVVVFVYFFKV